MTMCLKKHYRLAQTRVNRISIFQTYLQYKLFQVHHWDWKKHVEARHERLNKQPNLFHGALAPLNVLLIVRIKTNRWLNEPRSYAAPRGLPSCDDDNFITSHADNYVTVTSIRRVLLRAFTISLLSMMHLKKVQGFAWCIEIRCLWESEMHLVISP